MSKMGKVRSSPDHQLIGRFRKKSLFFRDTRNVQEHDANVRLSISLTSPENSVAEIIPLKENRPKKRQLDRKLDQKVQINICIKI